MSFMNMALDGGCGNDNGPQDIEDVRDMAAWHEKLRRAVDESDMLG